MLFWEDYDLSALIGTNKSFSFVSYGWSEGTTSVFAARTPGDPRDTEYVANANRGGMNRGIVAASGRIGLFAGVITNALGVYQHKQASNPVLVSPTVHEGSEVDDYVDVNQVVQDEVLTDSVWQDLDLSAHLMHRALCFILVEQGAIGTQQPLISVRRKGETLDFAKAISDTAFGPGVHGCENVSQLAGVLAVESNDSGIVDVYPDYSAVADTSVKFTLLGYIRGLSPPVITNESPADGASITNPAVNLSFSCTDADGDVVEASIDLDLTDPDAVMVPAIINGVFQTDYGGTIATNGAGGFDVTLSIHPPFRVGTWTAEAYCEDSGGRSDTSTWTFESARYRGISTGGNGLGLGGIYPLSGAARAAGYLWREEFMANHMVSRNRGTLVGAPGVDRGVGLDGATQYVSYDGQPPPCQIFIKPRQTWELIFDPNFAVDDGFEHVFFDADQVGTSYFSVRKQADDSLLVRLGAVDVEVEPGMYQSYWTVGERNTLIISAEDGDVSAWLNGTKIIDSAATVWDYRGVDGFFVGVDNGLASGFFDGTIHSIRQVAALIEDAEGLL